ncbi:DUF427 domain-containing protein [Roseibium sp. RKSG952]|uniref:DUF427 domain-containing protein n=1 Tax=Roseibium sp. RKSG952 TaxID=2529384 RepID=UPI0012BCBDB2|nr:DUF427 domain-containing protein [Roseibium sp. RKSG952]MTH99067.1 DUF427 domain-containing protein [Roseibium sp. RKSG952]
MPDPSNRITAPAFDNAIRNPADPNHLMVIKPVRERVRIYSGETLIANTSNACRVLEVGRGVYDPVMYIPEADLTIEFEQLIKSTHCPIKGDASYLALAGVEIGWVYRQPLGMAADLAARHAFWPSRTRLVIGD